MTDLVPPRPINPDDIVHLVKVVASFGAKPVEISVEISATETIAAGDTIEKTHTWAPPYGWVGILDGFILDVSGADVRLDQVCVYFNDYRRPGIVVAAGSRKLFVRSGLQGDYVYGEPLVFSGQRQVFVKLTNVGTSTATVKLTYLVRYVRVV